MLESVNDGINTVTNMTAARNPSGKHILEVTKLTVGSPLLSSRLVDPFRSKGQNTNYNRIIHELFKMVVFRRFAPSYKRELINSVTRVEAGSNTSTVTLRVVGADEKRNLKSETVKYCRESKGTRT
jgi:hypothetical protein